MEQNEIITVTLIMFLEVAKLVKAPRTVNTNFIFAVETPRLYKGIPVLAVSQDFYETDPDRSFARGYTLNAHGTRPVGMAKNLATEAGYWGKELNDIMLDYNFYAQITLVGEVLPRQDNAVTLSD